MRQMRTPLGSDRDTNVLPYRLPCIYAAFRMLFFAFPFSYFQKNESPTSMSENGYFFGPKLTNAGTGTFFSIMAILIIQLIAHL